MVESSDNSPTNTTQRSANCSKDASLKKTIEGPGHSTYPKIPGTALGATAGLAPNLTDLTTTPPQPRLRTTTMLPCIIRATICSIRSIHRDTSLPTAVRRHLPLLLITIIPDTTSILNQPRRRRRRQHRHLCRTASGRRATKIAQQEPTTRMIPAHRTHRSSWKNRRPRPLRVAKAGWRRPVRIWDATLGRSRSQPFNWSPDQQQQRQQTVVADPRLQHKPAVSGGISGRFSSCIAHPKQI